LLQESTKGLLDLLQLLDVKVEIDGFRLLRRILFLELHFLLPRAVEHLVLILPVECRASRDDRQEEN